MWESFKERLRRIDSWVREKLDGEGLHLVLSRGLWEVVKLPITLPLGVWNGARLLFKEPGEAMLRLQYALTKLGGILSRMLFLDRARNWEQGLFVALIEAYIIAIWAMIGAVSSGPIFWSITAMALAGIAAANVPRAQRYASLYTYEIFLAEREVRDIEDREAQEWEYRQYQRRSNPDAPPVPTPAVPVQALPPAVAQGISSDELAALLASGRRIAPPAPRVAHSVTATKAEDEAKTPAATPAPVSPETGSAMPLPQSMRDLL